MFSVVKSVFSSVVKPNPSLLPFLVQPERTVTQVSIGKGTRKTNKAVVRRFYRFNWGGWIHTQPGRYKKIWKKGQWYVNLRQHIFLNKGYSNKLDKMVTAYWKKPKYYVDDIYAPYHRREYFESTKSASKGDTVPW